MPPPASREAMPIAATPRERNSFKTGTSRGRSRWQWGHSWSKKFSTTTLPRSAARSTARPSRSRDAKTGARGSFV